MKHLKLFLLAFAMVVSFIKLESCQKVDNTPILNGINAIKQQNDSLLLMVESLQTSLDSVENQVKSNTTLLSIIYGNLNGLNTGISSLLTNITLLNSKLDSTNVNLTLVQSQLSQITIQYQNLSQQVGNIFTALTNQIDSLSLKVSGNTTPINLLQQEYLITQIKVDSIILQVEVNNQLLTSNNNNIALIQQQLVQLTAEYSNVIGLLNQLIALINGQTIVTTLSNGLVAWYPFSGSAVDSSGNGNNGTVSGATLTTDRFGNPNSAYSFNGINNYIIVPNSSSLQNIDTTNGITISAWVDISSWFVDAGGSYFPVLHKSDQQAQYGKYSLTLSSVSILGHLDYQETGFTYSNWQQGTWTHIAMIISGSSTSFFINGTNVYKVLSGVFPQTPVQNLPLLIGVDYPGLVEYANGKIDEVRIYNRALTQTEITYLAAH